MRAAFVTEHAPFTDLVVGELPSPVPGPGNVVIRIEAAEVNFPDILQIEGRYQSKFAMPFIPGLGGVGRVVSVGAGVGMVAVGQRVLTLPQGGTFCELAKVGQDSCLPVPEDVPSDVAAALGLVYQTAWFALKRRGGFQPGASVLVLGATGGVGMAAIQLAKAFGASCVIAATRGAEGAEIARDMGADVVVDSGAEMLRDQVLDATDGKGADIVIDPVGGPTSQAALRAMAWQGRLVVVGFASSEVPAFKGNYLLVKNLAILGLQWTDYQQREPDGVRAAQAEIFDLWRAGKLVPRISWRVPLDQATDALQALQDGRGRGKIILVPKGFL